MAEVKYKIGLSNADKATMANDIKDDVMDAVNDVITNQIDPAIASITNKVDIEGYYATLHAGLADQLASPVPQIDTSPYLFRTSGGIADLGTGIAKIDSLKGETKIFNQMVKNGDFSNGTSDWERTNAQSSISNVGGRLRITKVGATAAIGAIMHFVSPLVVDRKYLLKVGYYKQSALGTTGGIIGELGDTLVEHRIFSNTTDAQLDKKKIFTATKKNTYIFLNSFVPDIDDYFEIDDIMLIDLTLMYGAGNEPSTVAEFEEKFPNAYYDYSLPTIKNIEVLGIETVGFNLYNGDYAKIVKNDLVDNNGYKVSGAFDKVYFNTLPELNGDEIELTPDAESKVYPSENGYLLLTDSDDTSCISIVWSKWRENEFEEYWKNYAEIESGILNGIGDIADEITKTHKIQRFKIVDLGDLSWNTPNEDGQSLSVSLLSELLPVANDKVYNNGLLVSNYNIVAFDQRKNYPRCVFFQSVGQIYVKDPDFISQNSTYVKNAMKDVLLVYALKEESYILTEREQIQYKVDDFGTEEFILSQDSLQIPIANKTLYNENLRDKVRRIPSVAEIGNVNDLETESKVLVGAINEVNNKIDSLRVSPPLTNTSQGKVGQWAIDTNYLYVCIDNDTWKRIALSEDTWGEE